MPRPASNDTAKQRPPSPTLDQIDLQLIDLLRERAERCRLVAPDSSSPEKRDARNGEPGFRPGDWRRLLARGEKHPLPEASLAAIFREIESACRAVAQRQKVAYLGPEHSYSHLAAIERFGQSVELSPVATIGAVFEEVHSGQAERGIVPIENSTDGRVVDTLGMFHRVPVRICGEVQLRIHHCLLSRSPRTAIREIHSKPQALSQCRDWLAKHLPGVRLVENASTAAAAELAARQDGVAAIASRQAGVHYGLDCVAANIEDNPQNVTRFAVLASEPGPRTGDDKTALMMQIPHRPGALADAMAVFKRAKLNMTWIESFPLPGTEKEYLFFVECEGHESELRVRRALKGLEKKTVRLVVLGSYARSAPRD